jgi:glycosyltransferase involved in cell wall biosynthesis
MTPLFARGPLIASVQWFFAEQLARQYHLPFQLGERFGMLLYRNFIVQTEAMRRLVASRRPGARCVVIPSGLHASDFHTGPVLGDYILYLGRIDIEQKGINLLLQAYCGIAEQVRLPLVMAGGGFDEQRLRGMVEELGLAGWVRLLGKVDGETKARLLRECRFVCVPSRSETFGLVILEACAAAKPAIVFDRWPMNEVAVKDGCVRVPAFDVPGYAAAITALISAGEESLRRRGAVCREWAGRFQWDEIARRQEAFYLEVVDAYRAGKRGKQ